MTFTRTTSEPVTIEIPLGAPGPEWTIENPLENPEKYSLPKEVIEAGNKLSEEDKYHTDMPQEKYKETVIQRAIWYTKKPEKFNKEKLWADIDLQVKNTGGKQTPEQVQQLSDNIWDDVNLTLKEGQSEKKDQ